MCENHTCSTLFLLQQCQDFLLLFFWQGIQVPLPDPLLQLWKAQGFGSGRSIQIEDGSCIVICCNDKNMDFYKGDFGCFQQIFQLIFLVLQYSQWIGNGYTFRIIFKQPLFTMLRTFNLIPFGYDPEEKHIMGKQNTSRFWG